MLVFEQIMKKAERICSNRGARLTPKRRQVLNLLLHENKAMSAYEIAAKQSESGAKTMAAMSVYRILEFLEQHKLIHKISSVNKYAACGHIACSHGHHLPRIAVCIKCLKVQELAAATRIRTDLQEDLSAIDFHLENEQLELLGLCSSCNKAAHN